MHLEQNSEPKAILNVLKQIKSQKGQNLENTVCHCHNDWDWDRPKALQAIDLATTEGLITQIGNEKEQVSLRILEKRQQLLNRSSNQKTYNPDEQEIGRVCTCLLSLNYLEFKRYIFGEIVSLKQLIASKTKSVPETDGGGTVN